MTVTYWNKLVEDINGVSKQTPPTIGDKLLSNMKAAAVGQTSGSSFSNLRHICGRQR